MASRESSTETRIECQSRTAWSVKSSSRPLTRPTTGYGSLPTATTPSPSSSPAFRPPHVHPALRFPLLRQFALRTAAPNDSADRLKFFRDRSEVPICKQSPAVRHRLISDGRRPCVLADRAEPSIAKLGESLRQPRG